MTNLIKELSEEANLLQQRLREIESKKAQEIHRQEQLRSQELNKDAIAQREQDFEKLEQLTEIINSLLNGLKEELPKLKKFPNLGSGHYPDGSYKPARLGFSANLFEIPKIVKEGDRFVLTSESFRI